MRFMRVLIQLLLFLLPWLVRRFFLTLLFGYKLSPSARLGLCVILAERLEMGDRSYIGHFTFINTIDRCIVGVDSRIGTLNWITGTSSNNKKMFVGVEQRVCELIIGNHVRITSRHFLDCSAGIYIGSFTTIAGIGTKLFSHGIDVASSRQLAKPICVGEYCMIGSCCLILMGVSVANCCVVAAGSVVTQSADKSYALYAGVPARVKRSFEGVDIRYFRRIEGHVA